MGSYPVLLELRNPLEPQKLHDYIDIKLRSKFEIVPRGMELIEKIRFRGDIDGDTRYVIYFTKLAIAELFIHFDFPVVTTGPKQRMFDNPVVPYYQNAFSRMVASTTLVYVEGGGVSDVESHVQATLEDAVHGSGLFFKWTRRCSNNCWFMELASEELADLLVYRCNKQREGLFLFRLMGDVAPNVDITEVKPASGPTVLTARDPRRSFLASLAEVTAEQTPKPNSSDKLQLLGSKQADTFVHIGAPLPSRPLEVEVPNHHRDQAEAPRRKPSRRDEAAVSQALDFQTKLLLLVEMHTHEVDDQLALAIKETKPVIKPRVSWIDNRMVNIEMGSEVEADRLMDLFLERTMEFFNDPPMRLFRNGFYRRPGRRFRHDWGDETEIIIEGFPRGIHHLPGKAAVVELLGRAIGATKTTVTNFYMRGETARVKLRYRSAAEDVLENQRQLVLCGRTLTVELAGRTSDGRKQYVARGENRLSISNSRDIEDIRSRKRNSSREPECSRPNEFNRQHYSSYSRRNAHDYGRFQQDRIYEDYEEGDDRVPSGLSSAGMDETMINRELCSCNYAYSYRCRRHKFQRD